MLTRSAVSIPASAVSIPELGMDQQYKLVQPLHHQTKCFLQVFQGI